MLTCYRDSNSFAFGGGDARRQSMVARDVTNSGCCGCPHHLLTSTVGLSLCEYWYPQYHNKGDIKPSLSSVGCEYTPFSSI
jgi:hypothetical protein